MASARSHLDVEKIASYTCNWEMTYLCVARNPELESVQVI